MPMSLDPGVVVAVLLAGALHATWNTLVKSGQDRTATLVLVMMGAGIAWLPVAVALPAPDVASRPFLLGSVTVHFVYAALLLGAYRHGDLSQAYPISRGSAPVLVALGAWAVAGEALDPVQAVGIAVVSAGILSLAWRPGAWRDDGTGILFAVLTGISIALYIVIDGIGVRRSGAPLAYVSWLFIGEACVMALAGIVLRRGALATTLARNWARGLGGGVIASLSYGIALWAMSQGSMAHVTALRETSVLVAAVIGTRLLGEPFARRRVIAAAAVAVGAIVLQMAG